MQFEERAYGVDMWVCTKQLITDITSDNGMFQKLFAYITGANDRQEKIEMTSPVSTMRQKSTKGEIHEQCFYLYEKDPPKPTAEDVYLVKREAMNVYTRTVMETNVGKRLVEGIRSHGQIGRISKIENQRKCMVCCWI